MNRFIVKRQILNLINRFIKQRIPPEKFCSDFTKLWLRNRDIIYKQQEAWHEPYDQQLLEQWQSRKLTDPEFQHQWLDLWRSLDHLKFNTMVNAIHSTCSIFNPQPEYEWEIDGEEFFQEISHIIRPQNQSDSYMTSHEAKYEITVT